MTAVRARTESLTGLQELLDTRQALGLDRFDYYADGEYVIVPGPSPEHGAVVSELCAVLRDPARARGLWVAAQTNLGVDKENYRIPDVAVHRPDTRRTSAAFLAEMELVVEVRSPGEQPESKLDFYAAWNVQEHLDVDDVQRVITLRRREGDAWIVRDDSTVLGIAVADIAAAIAWP